MLNYFNLLFVLFGLKVRTSMKTCWKPCFFVKMSFKPFLKLLFVLLNLINWN